MKVSEKHSQHRWELLPLSAGIFPSWSLQLIVCLRNSGVLTKVACLAQKAKVPVASARVLWEKAFSWPLSPAASPAVCNVCLPGCEEQPHQTHHGSHRQPGHSWLILNAPQETDPLRLCCPSALARASRHQKKPFRSSTAEQQTERKPE